MNMMRVIAILSDDHREHLAVSTRNPRTDVERRMKKSLATGGSIELDSLMEFATLLGMKPEKGLATALAQKWNEVW